ncbi:methionyl-tRNA formyltransferase [Tuwongella immobilis]|uniref:Methionyl-tRNA formyltransferase n=1 Tax=Tuwongella immobilis TaxID=692036 RepID=A0A6C2YUE0_9BACT|nr:methionyl-tRNA formyltransferase [Tuwongella immobilis]VIP05054.1 methionyl-trna formyltransferase : Methionyl-tRNA formyltransferase OS=Planctomyces brasiliensis (strain ATCC 49424 / DSM 5305 / JCM 21570 / NBRC 103401 / IFAM 1448) GN=fmt PE=3 SV=1: Formyl_trans_N: Formyl_trans_C [Tuwongella immobilis]VTS07464.1 methionyl-trna formyltransferase : Methionyl-tRNA formyltransferase OS=Planctomyces brasiliensis (strain ATCC 49424 / DSM 5305 / JCM 21570 / NBRC 103401 / IFAM 1448) GN=fmt PE=3 SV=1: 
MSELRLVMMGTGTFAEPTLEAILAGPHPVVGLVTQPDRSGSVVRGTTRQTGKGMRTIAEAANVPVYQPENINTPEGIAALAAWKPDLLVVAAYGQILADAVIETARLGAINVHASLLPKYRGAAPIAWAIERGESDSGITIIRITTGLDAGEMLAQQAVSILPDETSGELEARLAPIGGAMACEVIQQIVAGTVRGIAQDASLVTRAPKIRKEQGLIDWSMPAERIARRVRAFQPWPSAYTFLHRQGKPPMRLILNRTQATEAAPASLPDEPGRLASEAGLLHVRCGSGVLTLHELQPAGKKRMSAAEFLRGYTVQPTDLVGPESLSGGPA